MRRFGQALFLAALSAVTAEFLLGDQWLAGAAPAGTQVAELILYLMFYGGAANLIRYAARRFGRGWPTILLYALAFGLVEEGIVDQSLFTPVIGGAHLLAYGAIPGLGISGPWTVFVLSLHVIWSIGAPIAITEAFFAPRPVDGTGLQAWEASWPGIVGAAFAALGVGLGGAAIFAFTVSPSTLAAPASTAQVAVTAVLAAVIVFVGAALPRATPSRRRYPVASVVIAAVLLTAYYAMFEARDQVSPWLCVIVMALLLAALGAATALLRLDPFGLAAGAILTYAWVGLRSAAPLGAAAIIEQVVIVAAVGGVLVAAALRRRRFRSMGTAEPQAARLTDA